MTVLILGSAGQIGSHLTQHLKSRGYKVIEFDIERTFLEDLRNVPTEEFRLHVQSADFVFFLAFDAGGSHYLAEYQDTFSFIDNNLKIMVNAINILRDFSTPFLFASSQMSNMNQSTYGILKSVGERYSKSVGGKVVKFWNVYGHEQNEKKFHVISDFIRMASRDGVIRMRTSGKETRDFLYADDCSEGLEAIMLNHAYLDKVDEVHLASFIWTSIARISEIVAKHFDVAVIPGSELDEVQKGIKNEPNGDLLHLWKPKTDIETGIKKVIYLMESSRKIQS